MAGLPASFLSRDQNNQQAQGREWTPGQYTSSSRDMGEADEGKAVLDITYFEENQLVDEDFPEESSVQKLKELICILSEPEDVVSESNVNEEPINILGAELLECLYWRKGALLYMYCHTAKERSEWLQENIAMFKKCLNDGVHYLMKMLSFRCPLQLNEDISFQDKDTARLLSEGIFSDTHLLALMYSGEMCYWGLKYCGEMKQESLESVDPLSNSDLGSKSQSTSLDFQETGKNMLTKYKKCCPQSRRSLKSSRPRHGAVTSFLQSLVTQAEPRFAMFGPGLEELDDSLVQKMMTCPEILQVTGLPHRQIHGIGSGVSFQFNNNQKFNILTLYSTTSVERRRARAEQAVAVNKMFYQENSIEGDQQAVHYSVIAQVKKVCEVVDGFIYVANAEAHKSFHVPEPHLAKVQDTVAATLDGLLNGIEWLLEEANCKNAQ
ncbi:F-box protein 4 [Willisornis vidua]|uniref:F-box protein 4 n=1 Tax=Willisornis vidua TaxID=1566151 RepID=A0ABQ9DU91_9PASS|nr:F-box protein 4 [Willisornis vidua]